MAHLLYFGRLPDQLGRGAEDLALPPDVADVAGLLVLLQARGGRWAEHLSEEQVQVTVNRRFAEPLTPVADGDEIALVSRSLR